MQEFYLIIALLTAGACLAMGSVSLFLGLKNNHKTDLIFGLMTLGLFGFIMLPPIGFITNAYSPYPFEILIKRVFNFSYYGLMPWFIYYYTGSQNKKVPMLISIGVVITYVMMATSSGGEEMPPWLWAALLVYAAIFFFGLMAGLKQYQHEKVKAAWFLGALSVFGLLFLLTGMSMLGIDFIHQFFNVKLFFSIHLHALFLVLVMGFRMVVNIDERFRLEKIVKSKERRWQSLLQHAPVFFMELDPQGNIVHINEYGVKLMEYSSPDELIGHNWFDIAPPEKEAKPRKKIFLDSVNNQWELPYLVTSLQSRKGNKLSVTWTRFYTYGEDGAVSGMFCVGIDTTGEESANKLINQLKMELEKEKIVMTNEDPDELSNEIIGNSNAIRYAIEKARQVSKTAAPVLLEGETGVGKELIADLIHKTSSRNHAPLVKVNCGALPKELIEDELFGHEKGAFTSAIQSRKGRFELADGGTIFLDEIGELPLEMQPKLLRVLQNGEFERVGGQKTIKVDVRIIAATNRELHQEVQQGRFRDDLFYRLNVFPITIPALRNRIGDLPLLINHFIYLKSKKYNKQLEQISKADMQRLIEYSWPGNVRELKNVIERSVIASEGTTLKLSWFLDETHVGENGVNESTLEQIERQHIIKIMESCHWKINGENGAAEKLNMHPNTLRSRMKKLGISRPVKDPS
jgi:PAS domain S-box-containing protein